MEINQSKVKIIELMLKIVNLLPEYSDSDAEPGTEYCFVC